MTRPRRPARPLRQLASAVLTALLVVGVLPAPAPAAVAAATVAHDDATGAIDDADPPAPASTTAAREARRAPVRRLRGVDRARARPDRLQARRPRHRGLQAACRRPVAGRRRGAPVALPAGPGDRARHGEAWPNAQRPGPTAPERLARQGDDDAPTTRARPARRRARRRTVQRPALAATRGVVATPAAGARVRPRRGIRPAPPGLRVPPVLGGVTVRRRSSTTTSSRRSPTSRSAPTARATSRSATPTARGPPAGAAGRARA